MKKIIIFILFVLSFISEAFCQDTLLINNGKKRIVKVKAISSEIIYYYNMDDSLHLIEFPKRYVSMIIYADGMKEEYFRAKNISIKEEKSILINQDTMLNKFNLGRLYSKKYYRRSTPFVISLLANSALVLTLATVPEPVIDNDYVLLIGPAISISMLFIKPPSRIAIPDMSLYDNPEFARGFRKQTSRDKNKSVLLGFVTGLAIDFTVAFLVSQ